MRHLIASPIGLTFFLKLSQLLQKKNISPQIHGIESEFREIQRLARIGNWYWEIESDTVIWSDELFNIFEVDQSYPLDLEHIMVLHHEKDQEILKESVAAALEEGRPYELELQIKRKNGQYRWILARGEAIKDRDGKIKGLRGTAQDISQRKLNEARQNLLLDSNRVLNEVLDYEERIQRLANLAVPKLADFCMIHTLEGFDVAAKVIAHRHSPTDRDVYNFLTKKNLPCKSVNLSVVNAESLAQISQDETQIKMILDLKFCSLLFSPLIANGTVIGCMTLAMCDESKKFSQEDQEFIEVLAGRSALAIDNARLFKEAKQAIDSREQLLAVVSHDLKVPLTAIKISAQLFQKNLPEVLRDPKFERWLRIIDNSTLKMDKLIQDLLATSKLESGSFCLDKSSFKVNEFLQELTSTITPLATEKSITLSFNPLPTEREVLADPDRLTQVISNLLSNAIKFTPQHGSILMSLQERPGLLEFDVCDSGPGIAPGELEHIFDKYWQENKTSNLGTGLGLSIAQGIVRAHGGEIWATNNKTRGCTVRFTLPV